MVDEADANLVIALAAAETIRAAGVKPRLSRVDDNINQGAKAELIRCTDEANGWPADCLVSIHNNSTGAGAASGTETFVQQANSASHDLGRRLQAAVVAVMGRPDRGIKTRDFDDERIHPLGAGTDLDVDADYYHVLREAKMPAVIVECGFMDNADDAALLKDPGILKRLGEAIGKAVLEWGRARGLLLSAQINGHPVGPARPRNPALEIRSLAYLRSVNPEAPDHIRYYVACGELFNQDWLKEFARTCLETGHYKYGGIVQPWQNNFSGLGALDGNAKGQAASFAHPFLGVLAQFEHAHAYESNTDPPYGKPWASPRYHKVIQAGYQNSIRVVEDYGSGKWATSKNNYGGRIAQIMEKILAWQIPETVPADDQLRADIARVTGERDEARAEVTRLIKGIKALVGL